MKKFSTYLLVMFMILFMILRIMLTITSQYGSSIFGVAPMNTGFEITIFFITLLCILLIIKRKVLGTLLYISAHGLYYGADLILKLKMIIVGNTFTENQLIEAFFSFFGIILPIAVLLDLLLDKNRKMNPTNLKTDWFYKDEKFDREFDERADKNNYRTM